MMSRAQYVIRWLLALIFIGSALAKLFPIELFELTLVRTGVVDWNTAPYVARLIIAIELVLGLCFLQAHLLKKVVIPSTFFLLLIFSVHLVATVFKEGAFVGNCGCFGEWIPMSPFFALVKNIVLLGLLGYLYRRTDPIVPERWAIPAGLVTVVAVAVFTIFRSPSHPAPHEGGTNRVHALAAFTSFTDFPVVDLAEGRKIVALFALDCEHCMEVAGTIGRLRTKTDVPPVFVLFLGEQEEVAHFFQVAQAVYPYRILDPMTFFPLLDQVLSPPRVVFLKDGYIVGDWNYLNFSEDLFEKTITQNR
jgi:hypothetical protein